MSVTEPGVAGMDVRGGRMFFAADDPRDIGPEETEAATRVLEVVLGPRAASCVLVVEDGPSVERYASVIAAIAGRVAGTHPHAPWGVLVVASESASTVQSTLEQVTSMTGDVVVLYGLVSGATTIRGAEALREAMLPVASSFVLATTRELWAEILDAELTCAWLTGVAVIDTLPTAGEPLIRALREHADRLGTFHAIAVPDSVVTDAALARSPFATPGRAGMLGVVRQPELGRRLIDQWAVRAVLVSGTRAAVADAGFSVDYLTERLSAEVVGQEAAVRTVAEQVALGRSGLRLRPDRPSSALLLTGPTGTGKTLLAQSVARALGARHRLIRVDLSSYTDTHYVATLLGSPPGYVGSTENSRWLTTQIAADPTGVLLLDEVDKADPGVWSSLLMELLGNGTLTDHQGRTVDARGLDVILTANLGAAELVGHRAGFGDDVAGRAEAVHRKVRRSIPLEVYNRLDAVVVLDPLSAVTASAILDKVLADLRVRLEGLGMCLDVTDAARAFLTAAGVNPADGARRLHRTVERDLVVPLLGRTPGRYRADVTGNHVVVATCPDTPRDRADRVGWALGEAPLAGRQDRRADRSRVPAAASGDDGAVTSGEGGF